VLSKDEVWKENFESERSIYSQNLATLQKQLDQEIKLRGEDRNECNHAIISRQQTIEAQGKDFELLSKRILDLQTKRDQLLQAVAQSEIRQEQLVQSAVEETKQACQSSCEGLQLQAQQQCEDQLTNVTATLRDVEVNLMEAAEANAGLKKSAGEVIADLQKKIHDSNTQCEQLIANQEQEIQRYLSNGYIESRIESLLGARDCNCPECVCAACPACPEAEPAPTCPAPVPPNCDAACKKQVDAKAAEMDRKCRTTDPEAELYRYDTDYALYSSGTKIVQNLTSPSYYPPNLHLSSIIKGKMKTLGLDEYQELVPDFSGEALLDSVGLQLDRGLPADALTPDLSLGSCWPMKVGLFDVMVDFCDVSIDCRDGEATSLFRC